MSVSVAFLNYLFSYVTELADRIRRRSSPDQEEVDASDEFVSFHLDFVWTLRDFSLELKIDGKPISADKYLENSLRLIQGKKLTTDKWCYLFPSITNIVTCFLVVGLKSLVISYVNTISSGDQPCMENALLALSQTENEAAMQEAVAHYDQQLIQKLQLPTETLQDPIDLHWSNEKEAIKIFRDNSFEDMDQMFPKELGVIAYQVYLHIELEDKVLLGDVMGV
ncbi:Guanylate-binding protein 1 [Lemmus lemmus]